MRDKTTFRYKLGKTVFLWRCAATLWWLVFLMKIRPRRAISYMSRAMKINVLMIRWLKNS